MIILQKLKWSNCFSYGPDNELDLSKESVTQILGHNGAGKSSIPLIIEEVLFNKNSKGIKKSDIANRFLGNTYSISLSFRKGNKNYLIETARKGNSLKAHLYEDGKDISSHTATNTYKTLQDLLGLDFKTFSQVVYQSTNSSLQFLTATDTNRKKFLIDLLHLEEYMALFALFKEESLHISKQVAKIEGEVEGVTSWLSSHNIEDTTLLPVQKLEISTEKEEEEVRSIRSELEKISEKNKKIKENNKNRKELESIDLHKYDKYSNMEKKSYDSLQSEAGQWKSKGLAAKSLVEKLEKLKDKCPTCEQSIDKEFQRHLLDHNQDIVDEAKNRLLNLKEEISEIKEQNKFIDERNELQRHWETLYRSIDPSLPAREVDSEELNERLQSLSLIIADAKDRMDHIKRANEEALRRNTRINVILEQREDFEEKLERLSQKKEEIESLASNLDILKKAFSTNGLVAYKIENLVKELEDLVNSYLGELSDGRFTLAFVISKDKLNVSLTDNGADVDISALSSGELARVNTSTLLAIRKLMSSISKSKINILFLDEVISTLDEPGREKLVEVLTGEEELNTYLVSHQWGHPLLSKLHVSKHNNISTIEAE